MGEEKNETLFCLEDYDERAKATIKDKAIVRYVYDGADANQGVARNRNAMKDILLMPKVCSGLKDRDLSTTILGHKVAMPFGFSPTMCRAWVHDEGEIMAAQVAAMENLPFSLSSWAETPLEYVAGAMKEIGETLRIYQSSIFENRKYYDEVLPRAEKEGFHAVCLTLDHGCHGNRKFDNEGGDDSFWEKTGLPNLPQGLVKEMAAFDESTFDGVGSNCETWDDIKYIKGITKMKILAKGISSPEDAKKAIEYGVDAIWISNHGGRQLGDGPATIDCLKKIAPVVKGTGVELYVDGGFRTGADVLKALAIGANCVFFGRPVISGIAVNELEGVKDIVKIMKRELSISMALCGCSKVSDIDESVLFDNY